MKESQIARIKDWIIELGLITVPKGKRTPTDGELVCPTCNSKDLDLRGAWIDNPNDPLRSGVISKSDTGARINIHYNCKKCSFGFEDSIKVWFKKVENSDTIS